MKFGICKNERYPFFEVYILEDAIAWFEIDDAKYSEWMRTLVAFEKMQFEIKEIFEKSKHSM